MHSPKSKPGPMPRDPSRQSRLERAGTVSNDIRNRLEQFIHLAERGLPRLRCGEGFAHTGRRVSGAVTQVRAEGDNLRYALMVALGLGQRDGATQVRVLGGPSASDLAKQGAARSKDSEDLGAVALGAWAVAEVAGRADEFLFERLESAISSDDAIDTVICAWALTAAVAGLPYHDTTKLAAAAAARLRAAQSPAGVFPHKLPATAIGRLRRHVGCFADQIYPIQALARYSVAFADEGALSAANACAAMIVAGQGGEGQWAWHYDVRTGDVVECYPVYSVHQHAMAPMGLLDLIEAGGTDCLDAVVKGVEWLDRHPETSAELVSEDVDMIWRKIARREPKKAVRSIASVTTATAPGLRIPGLDTVFPANRIDYECRPYELGWLIYAWCADTVMDKLRRPVKSIDPQSVPTGQGAGNVSSLFGLRVDAMRIDDVVARCRQAVDSRSPLLVGVVNASKVVSVRKDADLLGALRRCDVLLADGQSVVWASRLLRKPVPERVAGIDLFERLLDVAHKDGLSVYLLGAKPDVLRDLEAQLGRRFPGLRIAGSRHGYFDNEEAGSIASEIRGCRPDMLFLGMPSPKKETFLATFRDTLDVPVMHGVGGSFDVLAGKTKRAPLGWQKLGMEWAYRLVQEPRRMWRRYLKTNTAFIVLTVREMAGFGTSLVQTPDVSRKPSSAPEGAARSSQPEFHHG